jgi:hypothetical protein
LPGNSESYEFYIFSIKILMMENSWMLFFGILPKTICGFAGKIKLRYSSLATL